MVEKRRKCGIIPPKAITGTWTIMVKVTYIGQTKQKSDAILAAVRIKE